jgi:hypothetical protein
MVSPVGEDCGHIPQLESERHVQPSCRPFKRADSREAVALHLDKDFLSKGVLLGFDSGPLAEVQVFVTCFSAAEDQLSQWRGYSHGSHSAFWSVVCGDGSSYAVQIEADSVGSTRVLECSVLKAVAGSSCFTKFKDQ